MTSSINRSIIAGNQQDYFGQYRFSLEVEADWLQFEITIAKLRCILFLRDPNNKIRVQYLNINNEKTILLHRDSDYSDFMTVPGRLPSGVWTLELLGAPQDFQIVWSYGEALSFAPNAIRSPKVVWSECRLGAEALVLNLYDWTNKLAPDKKWYKGDFHTHTTQSDGKMTPEEIMAQAEARGLDFFAATDHHLLPTCWPAGSALVIPGIEISPAKRGHFNALGIRRWIDWRPSAPDGGMHSDEGMNRLFQEAKAAGALCSINHPLLMHWSWAFKEVAMASIDALEIWNDPTYPQNAAATERTLQLWSAIWNEGYTITGIGGSDVHNRPDESYVEGGQPSLIGDPATCVYSDGLSAEEILLAVRRGNVYVTRGPLMDGHISIGSRRFTFGEDITEAMAEAPQAEVNLQIRLAGLAAGHIQFIENGRVIDTQKVCGDGWHRHRLTLPWSGDGYGWIRADLRGPEDELLGFTNPIFYGSKHSELAYWGQLIESFAQQELNPHSDVAS